MRNFSDITDRNITPDHEFQYLDGKLHSHGAQIFPGCGLPPECTPDHTALIFSYADGEYRVRFHDSIRYTGADIGFSALCREQEMAFQSLDEMKSFLRNMQLTPGGNDRIEGAEGNRMQTGMMPSTDRQQLHLDRSGARSTIQIDAQRLFRDMSDIVRGQDEAIRLISNYACACAAKISPSRPISILVSGPTGTGKSLMGTTLASALNRQIDNAQRRYGSILVHCNEMEEAHKVSILTGAPAGYVGYGDETILSPVAANPYQVIIFDEIEKAHAKVLDVLMRALDSGEIMISKPVHGKTKLDLKRCILIFTSNIPLDAGRARSTVGFDVASEPGAAHTDRGFRTALVKQYRDALVANGWRREIVARFTDIIRYEQLDGDAVADIILQSIQNCAAEYGLMFSFVEPGIIQAIYDQTDPSDYGARTAVYLIENALSLHFAQYANGDAGFTYDLLGSLDAPRIQPHNAAAVLQQPRPDLPDADGDAEKLFDWEQDC